MNYLNPAVLKTHDIRKFDPWYAELPAPLPGNQVMSLDKALLSRRLGSIEDAFEKLSLHHALAVQLGLTA